MLCSESGLGLLLWGAASSIRASAVSGGHSQDTECGAATRRRAAQAQSGPLPRPTAPPLSVPSRDSFFPLHRRTALEICTLARRWAPQSWLPETPTAHGISDGPTACVPSRMQPILQDLKLWRPVGMAGQPTGPKGARSIAASTQQHTASRNHHTGTPATRPFARASASFFSADGLPVARRSIDSVSFCGCPVDVKIPCIPALLLLQSRMPQHSHVLPLSVLCVLSANTWNDIQLIRVSPSPSPSLSPFPSSPSPRPSLPRWRDLPQRTCDTSGLYVYVPSTALPLVSIRCRPRCRPILVPLLDILALCSFPRPRSVTPLPSQSLGCVPVTHHHEDLLLPLTRLPRPVAQEISSPALFSSSSLSSSLLILFPLSSSLHPKQRALAVCPATMADNFFDGTLDDFFDGMSTYIPSSVFRARLNPARPQTHVMSAAGSRVCR